MAINTGGWVGVVSEMHMINSPETNNTNRTLISPNSQPEVQVKNIPTFFKYGDRVFLSEYLQRIYQTSILLIYGLCTKPIYYLLVNGTTTWNQNGQGMQKLKQITVANQRNIKTVTETRSEINFC